MDTDQRIKAILIGDSKVGKTAIVTKITMDIFLEEELITDIGFDFKVKEVDFDDIQYKIYFWDIKQIKSRLLQSYLKNSIIIMMVYDVGNRNSFNSLSHYYDIIKNSYKDLKEKVLFLIAAKNDREDKEVDDNEAIEYANKLDMNFICLSVKKGTSKEFNKFVLILVNEYTSSQRPLKKIVLKKEVKMNEKCY